MTRQQEAQAAREKAARINHATAARLVRQLLDNPPHWKCEEDLAKLDHLAGLLDTGDTKRAMRYARAFATALREDIPCAVWVFMGGDLIHG